MLKVFKGSLGHCLSNIRDHIVSLRGLGGNRWLGGALLSLGKGSRFHPCQLACGFFDRLCEPPDQPPDEEEMDRSDENESPAEAGFLAGHMAELAGGAPSLILGTGHDAYLGDARLVEQIHDSDEILHGKFLVRPHDDGQARL